MNKVYKFFNNNGATVMVIKTEDTDYFWWWELERTVNTLEEAEAEANNEDNYNEGASCAGFDTVDDALFDYFFNN